MPQENFTSVISAPGAPLKLSPPLARTFAEETEYFPAPGLRAAADTAMLLGWPLLLTGNPGSGKTRAAKWLADALNAGKVLQFNVKSTTFGRDLLYSFDELARFRDANNASRGEQPLIQYLRLNPLGEAIVRAMGGDHALVPIAQGHNLAERAFGPGVALPKTAHLLPNEPEFAASSPQHRVVLIDELDKAPRDTPNDLLNEMDRMAFDIPEIGYAVNGDATSAVSGGNHCRPIVIITSNSERDLPDPFLRRCAAFEMPVPDDALLKKIFQQTYPDLVGTALFTSILEFHKRLHADNRIRKKPSVPELLAWAKHLALQEGIDLDKSLSAQSPDVLDGLRASSPGFLAKTGDDMAVLKQMLQPNTAGL